ncbi:MAG: V-type ATP synthase subunit K [Treponema sp.]|jgi:V/A-type H+-transporting ATPase subunit K|nr:V-type ATP synthase subunit K [Treponema sp.]
MGNLGLLGAGLLLGIAACGAALGIGMCATGAIGAWKKGFASNKMAPMTMLVFAGFPLTQIFYAFILLGQIKAAAISNPENGLLYFSFSLAASLAIAFTAWVQGKAGACACDALGETGKGFAQYISVIGISEPVALFAMVLTMISL